MIFRPVRDVERPIETRWHQIAFLGMAADGKGGYHACYREFCPEWADRETDLRYQHYTSDFRLDGPSRFLCGGEDPRVFNWRGRTLASVIYYPDTHRRFKNGGDLTQLVVDLVSGELHQLKHKLSYAGKNWAPVLGGERLMFIRSLEPLCVLEVDDDWNCKPLEQTPEPEDKWIGEHRCGTPAIYKNGFITGVGHRTCHGDPLRHVPFRYWVDLAAGTVRFDDFSIDGFGGDLIIDPTSEVDGLTLCSCAAVAWWQPKQVISHRLCEAVEELVQDGRCGG